MAKLTAISAFTPILTDIMYGVDDPGGTPISGRHTYQVLLDLLQPNLSIATSQLTGTLPDARVAASNVTQHQTALSIAATQLTGTLADARVAASNVTQHQAALSIAATQLTGTLADARVASSNVTQHQAALSVATSQLTGNMPDARIVASNVTQHQASITGLGTVVSGNVDAAVSAATASLAGKLEIATAAEIYAGTANKAITADAIDGALEATPASLSSTAASIAINLDSHFIFAHTTTENTTLANPTNGTIGQIYRLDVTQGATARTMNLGGQYRYVGGTWPGLTAIATALDRLWILKTGASSYDVKLDANVNNAS